MHMRILVVYISHLNHTKRMAHEIARRCEADLENIREVTPPDSLWGSWRSQWHAWSRTDSPIIRPTRNPARYELVIIGTPVWGSGSSPAVRSYVAMCHSRFKQVASFCAEGGATGRRGSSELGR